jgi:hypothetical protein
MGKGGMSLYHKSLRKWRSRKEYIKNFAKNCRKLFFIQLSYLSSQDKMFEPRLRPCAEEAEEE